MTSKLWHVLQRTVYLYRERGLPGVMSVIYRRLPKSFAQHDVDHTNWLEFKKIKDDHFDNMYKVDTGGVQGLFGLNIVGKNAKYGERYSAVDPDEFRLVLRALDIDFVQFEFIDLGSGKGRSLLLASEFDFRKLTGVEFAGELHAIAQANMATLSEDRRTRIYLLHVDAGLFEFPSGPLIVFLHNPFGAAVMKRVSDRLLISWKQNPRKLYVVYLNPVLKDIWLSNGWFDYKSGPLYSIFAPLTS